MSACCFIQTWPEMPLIRGKQISMSVREYTCPLAFLPNFNITHFPEYRQLIGSLSNDNGDSNENVISKYKCVLLIRQGCGSSSRMILIVTALNLGEQMKIIYLQVLTPLIKPQIWLFHIVVLQMLAKKWTRV